MKFQQIRSPRVSLWAAAVFSILGASPIEAEEEDLAHQIKVPAAEVDRTNAVVRLPLVLRGAVWDGVKVTDPAGVELPAQIAPAGLALSMKENPGVKGRVLAEVVVVIPEIKAGDEPLLKVEPAKPKAEGKVFTWVDEPGKHRDLKYGDKAVLRYMYEALDEKERERTYKPFHHVFDPKGEGFLTKGAGGKFTHHRGIYYGFSKTGYMKEGKMESADTWHCKPGAYQSHEEFVSEATGPLMGRHLVKIDWHGKAGEVIATEHRELAVIATPGGITIDFASVLDTELEKVKLDGDPQHAGFQFRASNEVNDKTANETIYIRKGGVGEPGEAVNSGDESIKNQQWKGMSFVVGGNRYTCCYLDRPDNPKPAVYSERNYGRFGSYFVKEVTPDDPLLVRYRLFLTGGQLDQETIATMAANFVANP